MAINQQTKGSIMPDSLKLVIAGMRRNELRKTDPQMCREIVAMCACVHILHVCVLPSAVLPWQCTLPRVFGCGVERAKDLHMFGLPGLSQSTGQPGVW